MFVADAYPIRASVWVIRTHIGTKHGLVGLLSGMCSSVCTNNKFISHYDPLAFSQWEALGEWRHSLRSSFVEVAALSQAICQKTLKQLQSDSVYLLPHEHLQNFISADLLIHKNRIFLQWKDRIWRIFLDITHTGGLWAEQVYILSSLMYVVESRPMSSVGPMAPTALQASSNSAFSRPTGSKDRDSSLINMSLSSSGSGRLSRCSSVSSDQDISPRSSPINVTNSPVNKDCGSHHKDTTSSSSTSNHRPLSFSVDSIISDGKKSASSTDSDSGKENHGVPHSDSVITSSSLSVHHYSHHLSSRSPPRSPTPPPGHSFSVDGILSKPSSLVIKPDGLPTPFMASEAARWAQAAVGAGPFPWLAAPRMPGSPPPSKYILIFLQIKFYKTISLSSLTHPPRSDLGIQVATCLAYGAYNFDLSVSFRYHVAFHVQAITVNRQSTT